MKDSNFPIFCYWCLADEKNTDPPILFTYPALIYPLCHWYLHENHTHGMNLLDFHAEVAKNNASEIIREISMLESRFFQSRAYYESFEFLDNSGELHDNNEFKEYLEPFTEKAKKHIWHSWGIIERDLRWAILDRAEPLEDDYNTVFGISKEYY